MSLDLTDILQHLDDMEDAWVRPRCRNGLRRVAADAEASMHATSAHGDITGATRAGYAAYVVSDSLVDQATALQALNTAVAAVESLNPGHSATAAGTLGCDGMGVILTCPTDYQYKLETERGGQKAVLTPTLQAYADDFTRAAASGT
jgi:hypothetical protein